MAGSERSPTLSSSLGSNGGSDDRDQPQLAGSLRSTADFGFTGTFISDDTTISGSLQIRPDRVIMWAGGSQLASWGLSGCRIERLTVSRFAVHADDETLTFTADDATGLQAAISDLWTHGEGSAVKRPISDTAAGSPRQTKMPEPGKPVVTRHSGPSRQHIDRPEDSEADSTPTPLRRESQAPLNRTKAAESELPKEPREPPKPERRPASRRSRTGAYQIPRSEPEALVAPHKEPDAPVIPRSEPDAPISRRPRIKNFQAAPSEAEPSSRNIEAPISRERFVARPAEEEEDEETIADEAIARSSGTRIRAARWLRSDIKEMGIKVAAVAVASILLGGFAYSIYVLAGGTGYEPEVFVQDPTTSIPSRPSATVPTSPVVTVPVPPTTLFDTDPAQLTERWNLIAEASSRPELVLLRDLTSPMLVAVTPFITLEGVLDPNVGYLSLRSTPTATPEGDGAILSSLGMVVAMSDPSLAPVDRRLLLEALGLDVRNPQLAGIDASLNYNGLTYRLTYFQDQNLLEFAIAPEVLATTTTAAP